MTDGVDEELELEIYDARLSKRIETALVAKPHSSLDRHTYFEELLRLQKEVIKLQDLVARHKLKLVVLFEGRGGRRGQWGANMRSGKLRIHDHRAWPLLPADERQRSGKRQARPTGDMHYFCETRVERLEVDGSDVALLAAGLFRSAAGEHHEERASLLWHRILAPSA